MATTKMIQSLERAFSILEIFQQSDREEYSLKEIAQEVKLNKSTTFGLINTLANLGYLQQNYINKKYALGLKLLRFSNAMQVQNSIIRAVHPYLEKLHRKYGETAHCAVGFNDSVIYVDKVESVGSIRISTQIGTLNDLHCTGVGKCILAYMEEADRERILSKPLRAMTANTITDPEQLRREIEDIRRQGYATDREEIASGLSCVAVPLFSGRNQVACAISVSGTTARIQKAQESGLAEHLKQVAEEISREDFGYYEE